MQCAALTAILAALRFAAATPICRVDPAADREVTPESEYAPVRDALATGKPKIGAGSGSPLFPTPFPSAVSSVPGLRLAMSVQF